MLPEHNEADYFRRVKALATIRSLTIKTITPYYGEGKFGEQPDDNTPETFVGPVAVLDADADWGNSNATI